jgi:cellulose 1,4-beta-cellobiosidase
MPSGWAGVLVSNANQIAVSVVAAPPAPTGLSALAGNTHVTLTWNATATAAGYYLKRTTTNGGPYLAIVANYNGISYTNTGLVNGTAYYYVVSATNAAGESANSPPISVRPVSPVSTNLAFGVHDGQLQLTWPQDHTGWHLQMQTNLPGTNWVAIPGVDATNYVLVPLTNRNAFFRLFYP